MSKRSEQLNVLVRPATRAMLDAELAARREAGWKGNLVDIVEEALEEALAVQGWRYVDGEAQQAPGDRVSPMELAKDEFGRAVEAAARRLLSTAAAEHYDPELDG